MIVLFFQLDVTIILKTLLEILKSISNVFGHIVNRCGCLKSFKKSYNVEVKVSTF